jgi:glycosyltransferase involved in cell wall biosynthesis
MIGLKGQPVIEATRAMSGPLRRIGHVSLGLEMGGMEKLLVEFARHADRDRYELHFVCLEGRGKLADEVEALGWPVETLGKRPGVRPGLVLKLAGLFRRLDLDVVHTHNEPACIYGVPAARLARVPLVLNTRHGQGPAVGGRRARVFSLAARLAGRVVCVSKDAADLSVRSGLSARRVTTIWNGIDTQKFPFRGPCPTGPAIVVARLAEGKNINALVRATPLVREQIPQFRLRVVGDGPCRPALEALTAELGLQEQVTFTGEADNVAEQLGRASMFVLPSLSEGVSLSLLEAMATGLPVVATSVGGNVEVVREGETGFLVPPRDPAGLARAIIRLAADGELSKQMGAAGRRRVETTFDVRAMVSSYERLYQEGLSRP